MSDYKKMNVKMEMYDVGDGFRIFVYEDNDAYMAIMMKEGYGVCHELWGIPKENDYDEYIDLLMYHSKAEKLRFKLEALENYGDEI